MQAFHRLLYVYGDVVSTAIYGDVVSTVCVQMISYTDFMKIKDQVSDKCK